MTEDMLRRAFQAHTETVEVSADALSVIRTRIIRRRARWWLPTRSRGGMMVTISTAGLVATATTVAVLAFGTAQCAPHQTPLPPAGTATPAPTTPGPTVPTQGPSDVPATTVPVPAGSANLAVYYIGAGNRLYREFHPLSIRDNQPGTQVAAAVTEMLDGRTAKDPDYHSSWPASTRVRSASVAGNTITVDLAGAAVNGYDPPSEAAALAQLVWTTTAVVPGSGLVLLLDGKPVPKLWNLLPTAGTLHRGSSLDVLAAIWLIDPQQGDRVARTFTIRVDGIAWEATAVVQIRDAGGVVVKEQPIHVGSVAVPNRATATLTVTLPPGRYTVASFIRSAKDGSVQNLDDHVITVN